MNAKMVKWIVVPLFFVGVVGAVSIAGYDLYLHHAAAAAATYNCIDDPKKPDEACASDNYYADYLRWKDLIDQINRAQQSPALHTLQEKADMANGLWNRLKQETPPGWDWDQTKRPPRFIKRTLPPTPPPTAPLAPAAQATPAAKPATKQPAAKLPTVPVKK